ncbi:MAG TPA: class I SAM-dependent methyltransferase [Dehalococcoidia bacterium]|nr:class I SAM-dependent methyltransferase [Dehalococcoidia bacterium]
MTALDVYADDELAALYDLVYGDFDDDLEMYEQFARRGELPSLEICAGSGRVALHLARQGLHVVGVDASLPMLARLEARLDHDVARRVRLVEGDMRTFDLSPEKFDLVFCAFGSFEQLLTAEDQAACLRTAARHLAKGAIFVAELRSLTAIDWDAEPRLLFEWTRPDPRTGEPITKLRSISASRSRQVTVDTVIFDRTAADGTVRRRQIEVVMRAVGRYELEYLLERAGLRLSALYGDTSLSPYTDESDSMIVVAELDQR